jgi:hypothetical protein
VSFSTVRLRRFQQRSISGAAAFPLAGITKW